MTKREKYFYKLLYWSDQAIKKEHCFMAPVPLEMETPNLIKTTNSLLESKIKLLDLDRKLNILDEVNYTEMLKKLKIIKAYLHDRKRILKKEGLL